MNYGILTKLQVLEGSIEPVIEVIRNNHTQARYQGHVESAFYLSKTSPQQFYIFSFWYSLEQHREAEARATPSVQQRLPFRLEILEREVFKLVWEFRRVDMRPGASSLRLMTFPPDYDEARLQQALASPRKHRNNIEGLVGSWAGQSTTNKIKTLQRMDWDTLEAQQRFFSHEIVQQAIAQRQNEGVVMEYASFNLQGLILPYAEPTSTKPARNQKEEDLPLNKP